MNTLPPIAVVASGEALLVAYQAGFITEYGLRLQKEGGYGEQPFHAAIGISSGSFGAAMAAAGDFNHERNLDGLVSFARETRFRPGLGRPINPYPQALQNILDGGLVDTQRAATSPTRLVITASQFNLHALRDLGLAGLSMILDGLVRGHFLDGIERLFETGARLIDPLYFSNHPASDAAGGLKDQRSWRVASTSQALRFAVEASMRIPFLYGLPLRDGADFLIDGAFADNVPVEVALRLGARHVFVVTANQGEKVYTRPIQSLALRNTREILAVLSRRLGGLAQLQERIPAPKPLDVQELKRRYPKQRIHVIHPKSRLGASRFFESDPDVLRELYQAGVQRARYVPVLLANRADARVPAA